MSPQPMKVLNFLLFWWYRRLAHWPARYSNVGSNKPQRQSPQ